MTTDSRLERYAPILEQVLKWRVAPYGILKSASGYQGCTKSFRRVIQKLEQDLLIQTKRFNGASKLIYPTNELIKLMASDVPMLYEDSITHEGLTSILVNELLHWEIFTEAELAYELLNKNSIDGLRRVPDAVIGGAYKGRKISLALEVELTRKSKLRIGNKLSDYTQNRFFNYVLYVFNHRGTFEGYKKVLKEFTENKNDKREKDEIQSRFILAFRENLIHHKFDLDKAEIFYQGKTTTFREIFAKKKGE